ncbi:MAG TPA: hypothetical protein VG649_22290, partial [Candidatus Angelobacter sp.]|nr:hypothetical protein [Candidatus Angelobacter sp.]
MIQPSLAGLMFVCHVTQHWVRRKIPRRTMLGYSQTSPIGDSGQPLRSTDDLPVILKCRNSAQAAKPGYKAAKLSQTPGDTILRFIW